MNRRKICGKGIGRLGETLARNVRAWVFPLAGGLSLLWWLVRVIPKPSRAQYPCMRAAFPAAAAFVVWLTGVWGMWFSLRRLGRSLNEGRYGRAGLFVFGGAVALTLWAISPFSFTHKARAFVPSEGANLPMGVGKGIYPGRVVWVRDPAATPWDGTSGHWWDDNGIDQGKVGNMLSISIRRLTGTGTDAEAWNAIFKFFNQSHDRGDQGYQPGEKIAVKINCNNAWDGYGDLDNNIDASPQMIVALLRQLVNTVGVAQSNITVYEAVRYIPNHIHDKIHTEFPEVLWVDSGANGVNDRQHVNWQADLMYFSNPVYGSITVPACVVEATYLINMALLKGHDIGGVTLTAKNYFGSIYGPGNLHEAIAASNPMGSYNPLVDLLAAPHLGNKTALFLIDGLFGVHNATDTLPVYGRWNNLFGGQWSSSLFASFDPVAIDSVGLDFLTAEFGASLANGHAEFPDNYLHEAAWADAPPSDFIYHTNGVTLSSLGVHEHWNNLVDKKYSRNLGLGEGIELVSVQSFLSNTVLVAAGSYWKFFADGGIPNPTWKYVSCDDSFWSSGRAELGYGNDPTTEIKYGPDPEHKYLTTYFRKQFVVENPAAYTKLTLGLKRDDGAVVYLNSHEVRRDNMPTGGVNNLTLALQDVSGTDRGTFFSTTISNVLVPGLNLLAVEVHLAYPNSDSLGFDLTLTGDNASPAVVLKAKTVEGTILLSWPDTPYEYLLSTGSPWPTSVWVPVDNAAYSYRNGEVQAAIMPNGTNHFYRLKRSN